MCLGKKVSPVSLLQESRPDLIDTSVENSQSTPHELLLRAARFGKIGQQTLFNTKIQHCQVLNAIY